MTIHNNCNPNEPCWCLHCERTYKVGEFRTIDGMEVDDGIPMQFCPYEGCDGDTFGDAWSWSTVKKSHPEYPDSPERNEVYPLYDVSKTAIEKLSTPHDPHLFGNPKKRTKGWWQKGKMDILIESEDSFRLGDMEVVGTAPRGKSKQKGLKII